MLSKTQINTRAFIGLTVLSILIVIFGILYYNNRFEATRRVQYEKLKTIADFKENQIDQWLKEREIDASIISNSPFFKNSIEKWNHNKSDNNLKLEIKNQLLPIVKETNYKNVLLVSNDCNILTAAENEKAEEGTLNKGKIKEAVAGGKIIFTDFYLSDYNSLIKYDIIAPIINKNGIVIASLVFRIDPYRFLYPLINKWPTESESAETEILRIQKDSILFLNDMRLRNNTAHRLTIPLSDKDNPAVKAASGYTGLFEGRDYRGANVLCDIRRDPKTNWIMVTKVDENEIYSGLHTEAFAIAGFCILLIALTGLSFLWVYNNRQSRVFKRLYNQEKELWQQQQKFKVTLDSLGEGVITLNTDGKVMYMNARAESLTGWKLEEAIGKLLGEVYAVKNEDTGEKENNIMEKVIKQGIVKELANHTILASKDGAEIPVMDTGAPIFDTDGSLMGIAIVFQDETEKRSQQKLLAASESRLYTTLNSMVEGCQIIGFDYRYLFLNNTALDHSKKSKDELIGNKMIECYPGIDKTEMFRLLKKSMEERIYQEMENVFKYPDGKERIFQLKFEPVPKGLLIISADITELRQTMIRLAESEGKFKNLLNSLPDGVITIDDNGIIQYCNNNAAKMFGYHQNELYNYTIEKLIPERFKSIHLSHREEYIKSPESRPMGRNNELFALRKDGSEFPTEIMLEPVKTSEKTEVLAIVRNITERKKMIKDLIEAKEKAEEMNRLKSIFFSNMSHELRTPLIGILGYTEILESEINKSDHLEMISLIHSSGRRLMNTLNNILNLSKLEAEKRTVHLAETEIVPIITETIKSFDGAAINKGLSLLTNIQNANLKAYIDKQLFKVIIENLLNNAINYTKKGEIIVKVADDTVYSVVEIKDTGIGIPEDLQEIIFEPFRQASEGLSRKYEGTGLGLTIVQKYAELMGGDISLKSKEGVGTTFTLRVKKILN